MCQICYFSNTGVDKQDNVEFSQLPSPNSCSTKLWITNISLKNIEYNGNRKAFSIKNEIINNLNELYCPMTCELKNGKIDETLSGTGNVDYRGF